MMTGDDDEEKSHLHSNVRKFCQANFSSRQFSHSYQCPQTLASDVEVNFSWRLRMKVIKCECERSVGWFHDHYFFIKAILPPRAARKMK